MRKEMEITYKELFERMNQKYIKIRCPFHEEKTPSMVLAFKKGIFHCFGCGKKGDIEIDEWDNIIILHEKENK